MNALFYPDKDPPLYEAIDGGWHIIIVQTGFTHDADPMIYGTMECAHESGLHRLIGLVWDTSRTLVDYDGVTAMTERELAALLAAGFIISDQFAVAAD